MELTSYVFKFPTCYCVRCKDEEIDISSRYHELLLKLDSSFVVLAEVKMCLMAIMENECIIAL
jgi:hypothetical protein